MQQKQKNRKNKLRYGGNMDKKEIAKLNVPVIFHTGILWDGRVSSNYNRPLHWESLLPITNLRFSMGHCSWPWVDECIALYGKFLKSVQAPLTLLYQCGIIKISRNGIQEGFETFRRI